jgi:hypothetical protein
LLPNTEKFELSTRDSGRVAMLSLKLTGRLPDVKAHTFMMLKEVHDFKEIVGARIAGWTERAHEAFGGMCVASAKPVKPTVALMWSREIVFARVISPDRY